MMHRCSLFTTTLSLSLLYACNGGMVVSSSDTDHQTSSTSTSESNTTEVGTSSTGEPQVQPVTYQLRLDDDPVPPVVLEMDREKMLEVFGEAAARDLVLLEVDSTRMLENALAKIQEACGTSWQNESLDPKHNCSLTELGKSFGPEWKTSPEFALVRMLTMTPANVVVEGTSLQSLRKYLEDNDIVLNNKVLSFKIVLEKSLGLAPNQTFISIPILADAIKQTLLASHPNVGNDEGKLKITLWDAANNMQPLSEVYGPVGEHPGILVSDDDTFTTHSNALTDEFRMKVTADSNLRRVDGIDLSNGSGDMFVSDTASILSFDFNDPEKLEIYGIAPEPTVDLRMRIGEHLGIVPPCASNPACQENTPQNPVGKDTIWSLKPWMMEYIVTYAARLAYIDRYYEECFLTNGNKDFCYTGVWIGGPAEGNPGLAPEGKLPTPFPNGWSRFKALDEPVPPPQYLWELLLEIAQVALHDPTGDGKADIEEGKMVPTFALYGVAIGLTADEMIAQIRPKMQEQADKVAEVILGKYWKNNHPLDFYYRRATGTGEPYLFFIGENDLRPDAANPEVLADYTYTRPGFFSCPELTDECKLSSKSIPGLSDTNREKLKLPVGHTSLYMQDDEHKLYKVDFFVPAGDVPLEIRTEVEKLGE